MASIFLSAGEASGDHYGAEVMAELRLRLPEAGFFGLGGPAMAEAGLDRVVRAEDVAVMGVTEILRHVPRIVREYRRLVGAIRRRRPEAAVLIDFPDVNFRLAKQLKRMGVPVVWFVSPQLWAWKRRRLRWVQERVDRMMVIFPFEEGFYRARGVAAEFVGHPLAGVVAGLAEAEERAVAMMDGSDREADPYGMTTKAQAPALAWATTERAGGRGVVALLPGSRWKEVEANLPEMLRAAEMLGPEFKYVLPVASTIDRGRLEAMLRRLNSSVKIALVEDARAALAGARASVVASGTATVLAAVVGHPFVVVYRVSAMTFRMAKQMVRYPKEILAERDERGVLPVAMVNLLAGRRVVPELINEAFTAEWVAAAMRPLLGEGPEREAQMAGLRAVRNSLWPEGVDRARGTARVAEVVVELMEHDRVDGVRG